MPEISVAAAVGAETFLNGVYLACTEHQYAPGDEVVAYSDPADRLIIVMTGQFLCDVRQSVCEVQLYVRSVCEVQLYVT